LLLLAPPVAASDYTLGIFGNANEDDTINMQDVTYTELIILEYRDKTELSDAKYDGKINMQDVTQIELVILGKEKEVTVSIHTRPSMGSTEITERPVTISKPVERIVVGSGRGFMGVHYIGTLRALKLDKDRIAGVTEDVKDANAYFPEFSELPCIGKKPMDYEAILNLHPDLMIVGTSSLEKHADKLPGVTVVAFDCWRPETYVDELRRLGYILDKNDEAEEFIDFYSGVMDTIRETVDEIPEEDRPKVYFESRKPYSTGAKGSGYHAKVTMAGGNNIFGDLSGYPKVDPEEVIKRNPEIIIKYPPASGSNYHIGTDVTELIDVRNEIMNRPELAEVEAVKNGKVNILTGDVIGATRHFVGIGYMAKWFHPELFEDFDPDAIHQEYITRFQGLPDDFLDEHGVFVYPPPEES
ncbi:MAG: ABC transporter substrate-binding protein, partial [Euryarchaeota archaeon]|nr:ABC transporter substrate-binding protein [Euryarchaeota archaeon]